MAVVCRLRNCRPDLLQEDCKEMGKFARNHEVDWLAGLGLAASEAEAPLAPNLMQMRTELHHGDVAQADRTDGKDGHDQRVAIDQLVAPLLQRSRSAPRKFCQNALEYIGRGEDPFVAGPRRLRPAVEPVGQLPEPAPVGLLMHALHDAFEADEGRGHGARGEPVDQTARISLDAGRDHPPPGRNIYI
jgi:hypothetical protein